jgi:hypothetical protein
MHTVNSNALVLAVTPGGRSPEFGRLLLPVSSVGSAAKFIGVFFSFFCFLFCLFLLGGEVRSVGSGSVNVSTPNGFDGLNICGQTEIDIQDNKTHASANATKDR